MHETQRNAQAFNDAAALNAERAHGEIERGIRDQQITRLEADTRRLKAALREIQSEIDGKADADIDGPNIFMRIDSICDRALEGK